MRRLPRRVVVTDVPADGADRPLDADAAHYVERVLRLADGHPVELLDGSGRTALAVLQWRDGVAWAVAVSAVTEAVPEPAIVLAAALIKATRWEWVIEKAAELGATRIIPLDAARSVVRVPAKKADAKLERWGRIAAAAARQSGRALAPTIDPPASLRDALAAIGDATPVRLDFGGRAHALDMHAAAPIAVFVGPEGGFTDDERRILDNHGAVVASLGDAVLRAETASLAALAAIRIARARA